MRKKRLKLKWKNLFKLIILAICISTLVHDLFMITIYGVINKVTVTWTWEGFITFLLSGHLSEYLIEEIFYS